MKKLIFSLVCCWAFAATLHAQKWNELTDEQKLMKLKTFRTDNQQYLKDSLGMTATQRNDIDNVNACYLGMLDRINRYAKVDSTKEKLAEAVTAARWVQLDAIMGVDKHSQYAEYLKAKIIKAGR